MKMVLFYVLSLHLEALFPINAKTNINILNQTIYALQNVVPMYC